MIASVIKTQFGTVVATDRAGRKISRYCRIYKEVKEAVLKEAPADAEFFHENKNCNITPVFKENW